MNTDIKKIPCCQNGQPAFVVCVNQHCKQIPFICAQQSQSCQRCHLQCKTILWRNLLEMAERKRNFLLDNDQKLKTIHELLLFHIQTLTKVEQKVKATMECTEPEKRFNWILQSERFNKIDSALVNDLYTSSQDKAYLSQTDIENLIAGLTGVYQITKNFYPEDHYFKKDAKSTVIQIKKEFTEDKLVNLQVFELENKQKSIIDRAVEQSLRGQVITGFSQHMPLRWSSVLKGKDMEIRNLTVIKTKRSYRNFSNTFALMQPALSLKEQTVWCLKLIQRYMQLGICLKNIIVKNNFGFSSVQSYKEIGHGVYSMSPQRFCYSHHKQTENHKKNGFWFTVRDQLVLRFTPRQRKLVISSKDHKHVCEIQVQIPEDDELYACVWLGSPGDSAEIIRI